MRYFYFLILCLLLGVSLGVAAQKRSATVQGLVLSENGERMAGVSVSILGRSTGVRTDDSGHFQLQVPSNKAFALLFSFTGFRPLQRNFILNENEEESISVILQRSDHTLEAVTVTDQRGRRESGSIVLNPKNALNIPAPVGGIESLIKVMVGSNNELTSQYSVRGGNYDENLVYVNDFEVFRPYLVKSGQQEGLSFINPEMVRNVQFFNGGFQARYGDKMSSVLDIQYKKPKSFGGSAYIGLLEQGLSLEGSSHNTRFTYLLGLRNRSNRKLLSSQETQGNYVPSSSDVQGLFTWQTGSKSSLELLANFSVSTFKLVPAFSQLTSSIFTPYFTSNLGLDIYFEGKEEDRYRTAMAGLSFVQQPTSRLKLKWMISRFSNKEKETYDITGAYLFGQRDFDKGSNGFGQITQPLGAGLYQDYARNFLEINTWNVSHKGSFDHGRHYLQWGQSVEQQNVHDHLLEWQYQDSAGYNIPLDPDNLVFSHSLRSAADPSWYKFSGYLQDNLIVSDSGQVSVQAGIRYNYNTLNREFLVSPRLGLAWSPHRWKKDIIFRGSAGLYHQPPFYRELRKPDGSLNESVKAQKSAQISAGFDYNFRHRERPYRLVTEAYYKKMWDVIPYDIDNVRIRYTGTNSAKAYATGIELRLFGELVKDAESWISIGFMRTRENLDGDRYFNYTVDSVNRPVDSVEVQGGWFRRPTDRFFNFGMFLQDYLSTNKNFKVYLNFLYGSNMPYNIPGSVKYRNGLIIDPYMRIDVGFSALLLDSDRSARRSHHPLRQMQDLWIALEIFNLIDRDNTISYQLVRDYSNTVFAMPNRLTPRLLNLKLAARF